MNSSRFEELWTDFLEGELNESELLELQSILEHAPELRAKAIDSYHLHRLLGLLMEKQSSPSFVEKTIERIPAETEHFVSKVIDQIDSNEASLGSNRSTPVPDVRAPSRSFLASLSLLIGLSLLAITILAQRSWQPHQPERSVVFASTAHSKFLGEFSPAIGSVARWNRDYVLTSGWVELLFPKGAEVILEGPAVFQIASDQGVKILTGKCSVHAPEGAEGFFVDTPDAKIVDRGTRFAVSTSEVSSTEVHVLEGAAEIHPPTTPSNSSSTLSSDPTEMRPIRLTKSEAKIISDRFRTPPRSTPFRSKFYHSRLPDRVVCYEATIAPNGGAEELLSVTVQRNGINTTYRAAELIPVELTSFRVATKLFDSYQQQIRHMATRYASVEDRRSVLSDRYLNTGAINPGGSVLPAPYASQIDSLDPKGPIDGMGIRFQTPILNRPGPDVVLFELEIRVGIPDGDSFHVVPIEQRNDLHPYTVQVFDLTLTSSETKQPADFFLHEYNEAVTSLDHLLHGECRSLRSPQSGKSYGLLAVAIDLSNLGYSEGEPVDGLFLQDTLNDDQHFDPVLIAGLP